MSTFAPEILQMELKERISAFAELGKMLLRSLAGREESITSGLQELINRQQFINPWFTPDNVNWSLNAIARELNEGNLNEWTKAYPLLKKVRVPLTAGIIMAGNIPLAGFHDFLSVLISGNRILAKTSSKDSELIVKISEILCKIEPRFSSMIEFTDSGMKGFDVIIATGSNNSSRYFEYYFGRYPNIIRRNRNSVAVLDGSESAAEIDSLGSDVFLYFGLGCRSVSKIYVPQGYDLTTIFPYWQKYSEFTFHTKYANNYDYNKAIYLVNRQPFLDSGYLIAREDRNLSSPVAVLHYEQYESKEILTAHLKGMEGRIQCIVGHDFIPFGTAQTPHLWDYADGIDTIEFLSKKNSTDIL